MNTSVHKPALRAPLGRARGFGSSRAGAEDWWHERLLAIGLVPLVLWFAFSAATLSGAGHAEVAAWMASPLNATLVILLVFAAFRHGQMGLCNVIRDYVKVEGLRFTLVILAQFAAAALGLASAVAVLKIAVGG